MGGSTRLIVAVAVLCLWRSPAAAQEEPPQTEADAPDTAETDAAEPSEEDERLARARDLFMRGVDLSEQERWGTALQYFKRSLTALERPNTLFNIAGILARLGRGSEAIRAYERYLEIAGPDDDPLDLAEARQALEVARGSIATLELQVSPDLAVIRVDGSRVRGRGRSRTVLLDPGEHTLQVSAPEHYGEVIRVSALPGARGERTVELEPIRETTATGSAASEASIEAPPPRASSAVPEIAIGASSCLVAGGGLLLLFGLLEADKVNDPSIGTPWEELDSARDRANLLTALGAALTALGVAGIGFGIGWLLATDDGAEDEDDAPISIGVGPGGLIARGEL